MLYATGLPSALTAGQVPPNLELKVEKPDKDEMHDNLTIEDNSDDESDKNMRTPRAGTRTRYKKNIQISITQESWEGEPLQIASPPFLLLILYHNQVTELHLAWAH